MVGKAHLSVAPEKPAAILGTNKNKEARPVVATPVKVGSPKAVTRATVHVLPFGGKGSAAGGYPCLQPRCLPAGEAGGSLLQGTRELGISATIWVKP